MHIITRPNGGRFFHVCRVIPGRPPLSVGEFQCEAEASEVCRKLDSVIDCITEEPIPEDMDDLLCMI